MKVVHSYSRFDMVRALLEAFLSIGKASIAAVTHVQHLVIVKILVSLRTVLKVLQHWVVAF